MNSSDPKPNTAGIPAIPPVKRKSGRTPPDLVARAVIGFEMDWDAAVRHLFPKEKSELTIAALVTKYQRNKGVLYAISRYKKMDISDVAKEIYVKELWRQFHSDDVTLRVNASRLLAKFFAPEEEKKDDSPKELPLKFGKNDAALQEMGLVEKEKKPEKKRPSPTTDKEPTIQ